MPAAEVVTLYDAEAERSVVILFFLGDCVLLPYPLAGALQSRAPEALAAAFDPSVGNRRVNQAERIRQRRWGFP